MGVIFGPGVTSFFLSRTGQASGGSREGAASVDAANTAFKQVLL